MVSAGRTLVGAGLPAMAAGPQLQVLGLGLDCVGWQYPCGSWLASDGIAAVWLSDRSYRFWVFLGGVAGINPGQAL